MNAYASPSTARAPPFTVTIATAAAAAAVATQSMPTSADDHPVGATPRRLHHWRKRSREASTVRQFHHVHREKAGVKVSTRWGSRGGGGGRGRGGHVPKRAVTFVVPRREGMEERRR